MRNAAAKCANLAVNSEREDQARGKSEWSGNANHSDLVTSFREKFQ